MVTLANDDGHDRITDLGAPILLIESGRYLIWNEPGSVSLPKAYRHAVRVHPDHHDHLPIIEKILHSAESAFVDGRAASLPGVLGGAFVTENKQGHLALYAQKLEGSV